MRSGKPTFVYEVDGAWFADLVNGPQSYDDNLRRLVSPVGGPDRSTFSRSQLPDGQSI